MKRLLLLPLALLLTQCSPDPPRTSSVAVRGTPLRVNYSGSSHEIINVSAYDPKERHRSGSGYSEHDVSALKRNGARGLIARAGKGGDLDEKCASFIASADRAGLLAGVYYRVQKHKSPESQADQFVSRAKSLTSRRPSGVAPLLLCGDYDGDLSLSQILRFMDRVEARTGVVPITYLENSQALKLQTRSADSRTRARLLRAPYWVALYSHESGKGPVFPAPGSPEGLVKQYGLWSNWTMWQYGGVSWENRRSNPKVFSHGRYRNNQYFGNMDRPLERNLFRGSYQSLVGFWARHGLAK
ncbi:GH25 family lysozyme [Verrucomicrobiaceae bacterium 227]